MNKIEALKTERDALRVLEDIPRFAAEGWESIAATDLERLKWYGLFHRKTTPGHFMLRIRMPSGVLTSEQLDAVAEIAERCGRGAADLTTRQAIQLRWIRIEDVPWVLQRLGAAGLTSQQSGMDSIRNVLGCPLAGLDADEVIDTRAVSQRLQQAIIGSERFSNLPRKMNIAVMGCRQDCCHAQANDLSFVPAFAPSGVALPGATAADRVGFNVIVGGALGGQDPFLGIPFDVFVTEAEVVPFTIALLETFRDHGPREQRKAARLKVLLRQLGGEALRELVAARLGAPLARAGEPVPTGHGDDHIGVVPQRQPGFVSVGLCVPVGRTSAEQLRELARLAGAYGRAEVRLTVQQNVLIPDVPFDDVADLMREPLLETLSADPSAFTRALVSCTGNDFCHFSLIDTKGEALKLAAALDARYELAEPISINMSGCPHSCGQHRVAEIGLRGDRVRTADGPQDAAHVYAGGVLGPAARLAEPIADGVLIDDLPELVADQIRALRGPEALRPRAVVEPADAVVAAEVV